MLPSVRDLLTKAGHPIYGDRFNRNGRHREQNGVMLIMYDRPITNDDDIIGSRDVIARIEYLKQQAKECLECGEDQDDDIHDDAIEDWHLFETSLDMDEERELEALRKLAGEGENVTSDWPDGATLVRESYFEQFAQQEAEDLDLVKSDATWPANCIDWKQAAWYLRMDYTSIDFDGTTYWVRS